jgi:hypothetical protein
MNRALSAILLKELAALSDICRAVMLSIFAMVFRTASVQASGFGLICVA